LVSAKETLWGNGFAQDLGTKTMVNVLSCRSHEGESTAQRLRLLRMEPLAGLLFSILVDS